MSHSCTQPQGRTRRAGRAGRKGPGRAADGYLLLEAVISLGIIAIALFAMLSVQQEQIHASQRLARYEIGLEAANCILERLRAAGPLADAVDKPVAMSFPSAEFLPQGKCCVTVSDFRPDTPGLKRVKVEVAWSEKSSRRKSVVLETLVMEGGAHAP